MTHLKVNIVSWNRFITRNLVVVPELLGLTHEFQFESGLIRIELPAADKLTEDKTKDSRLVISAYKTEEGIQLPTRISVKSIDLVCNLSKSISIPAEVLTRHPNPIDLLTEKQQKQVNDISNTHSDIAYRAFELWIGTLRWKSGNGSIGTSEIHGSKSGWSTYLLNEATNKRFWAGPHALTTYIHNPVTLEQWNEAQEALKLGLKSPVYIDLLFEGIEQLKNGDIRRTVVDLAVACEAFIRLRVMQTLPDGLTDSVRKYIDDANIRQSLNYFILETLNEEQKKLIKGISSTLHQLFDARNTILHSGYKEDLTQSECRKYLDATRKLISIT